MPLDRNRCEQIISLFTSLDVTKRLEALNEARKLYDQMFRADMSPEEYAYSAKVLEQLYNLIRDELRVSQIRIKADIGESTPASKPKSASKPKKAKPATPDIADLLAQFKKFTGESNET